MTSSSFRYPSAHDFAGGSALRSRDGWEQRIESLGHRRILGGHATSTSRCWSSRVMRRPSRRAARNKAAVSKVAASRKAPPIASAVVIGRPELHCACQWQGHVADRARTVGYRPSKRKAEGAPPGVPSVGTTYRHLRRHAGGLVACSTRESRGDRSRSVVPETAAG